MFAVFIIIIYIFIVLIVSLLLNFISICFLCPRSKKEGHIALHMSVGRSVGLSVGMSVSLNVVQLVTQEHFAPRASNLV